MRRFLRRTKAIAHKELIHMIRDVRVVYLALGLPVVMLALFGFAVSMDIDHIPLAVVDQDQTRSSRRLVESLVVGDAFVVNVNLRSAEEAEPLLRRGSVKAVLVIPPGYQRALVRGSSPEAQLLVDGSDGTVAAVALGEAMSILQAQSLRDPKGSLASVPVSAVVRNRFNPGTRSAYSIVPGVIVMILGLVANLLSALTIAREWERGNLEQLFATPVTRTEILVGKLVPYAALGMLQTLLILTLGSAAFDVPIAGSVTVLAAASALFVLCMLGIGLLVSVTAKTQLLSVQMSGMLGYMPAMLLSGFLFPIANMPWWLRGLSSLFPARYYLSILRGVMLKGNGVEVVAPFGLALLGFSVGALVLATRKFQRRIAE